MNRDKGTVLLEKSVRNDTLKQLNVSDSQQKLNAKSLGIK